MFCGDIRSWNTLILSECIKVYQVTRGDNSWISCLLREDLERRLVARAVLLIPDNRHQNNNCLRRKIPVSLKQRSPLISVSGLMMFSNKAM